MKNKYLLMAIAILVIATSAKAQDTANFKDPRDSKTYKTITIGSQTWMAENLAYKAGSGCWAYGDDINNVTKYGYLYNYEIAKTVCPPGWHLPSDAEWQILITYLGGEKAAGSKLKENGFLALAGGFRNGFGIYSGIGTHGLWWSSTWGSALNAWYRLMTFEGNKIEKRSLGKISGFSVRCVKD
jgi:uncharacterized protein (TIGR02145 family)